MNFSYFRGGIWKICCLTDSQIAKCGWILVLFSGVGSGGEIDLGWCGGSGKGDFWEGSVSGFWGTVGKRGAEK